MMTTLNLSTTAQMITVAERDLKLGIDHPLLSQPRPWCRPLDKPRVSQP